MTCNLDLKYTVPKNHGTTYKLHYMFLSGCDRTIYKAIFDALDAHEPYMRFNKLVDQQQIWRVFLDVLADNPTLFWVEKKLKYWSDPSSCEIVFSYIFPAKEVAYYKVSMTRKVDEIHAKCSKGCKSDMELALRVHDYLTENVKYVDDGNPEQQSMVGPLMLGRGVCEGIAFAYSYLMSVFGINCTTVYGQIKGEKNGHAWNMIFLDGNAYHIDVTHDLACTSYKGNHINFNLKDEDLSPFRTWDSPVRCDSTEFNYFDHTETRFRTFQQVCDFIRSNISYKDLSMEFRITPNPPRDKAIEQLDEYIRDICKTAEYSWSGKNDFYHLEFKHVKLKR